MNNDTTAQVDPEIKTENEKTSDANRRQDNAEEISVDQSLMYAHLLQDLRDCVSLEEMLTAEVVHKMNDVSILNSKLKVDNEALKVLPDEIKTLYPVVVKGDGNCLPRSASVIVSGSENSHIEMRARIALEFIRHINVYIDFSFLQRGFNSNDKDARYLPKAFAMYSDHFKPGDVLTDAVVKRTFFQEIKEICRLNSFMGIWQVFALASVLQRILRYVYPELGNPNVRNPLNRDRMPREMNHASSLCVMCLSNRTNDMILRNLLPNHFCSILSISHEVPDGVIVPQYDDIIGDLSMNSDQIENIIYSLCTETDESLVDPLLMNPFVSIDACQDQIEAVVSLLKSECSPSESQYNT